MSSTIDQVTDIFEMLEATEVTLIFSGLLWLSSLDGSHRHAARCCILAKRWRSVSLNSCRCVFSLLWFALKCRISSSEIKSSSSPEEQDACP